MQPVVVRNVVIGEGIPKICVPIVGRTVEEIKKQAKVVAMAAADLVEWRMDWYENVFETEQVLQVLCMLREQLQNTPILCTFRTAKEGGERAISAEQYAELNEALIRSGNADLIDVELFFEDCAVSSILECARQFGVKVIMSNHDFQKTPSKEEMIQRLCRMQELGADILKIAVMPQSKKDVLTLLEATVEMVEQYAKQPVVTMSMASMGVLSRMCGEVFGSAMTFGAAGKISAPGQVDAQELGQILGLLHKNI